MKKNYFVIGYSGPARSGKNTASEILSRMLGGTSSPFAKPIKDACEAMFPWWGPEHREGHLKEIIDPVLGFSPRRAYQTLGTEWGRGLNDSIWLVTKKKILESIGGIIHIPDVRFINEAEMIYKLGGIIISLDRSERGYIAEDTIPHASEDAEAMRVIRNSPVSISLNNNGDFSDLDRAISREAEKIQRLAEKRLSESGQKHRQYGFQW